MIPVTTLEDVQVRWIEIREHGFVLHGFLLYTESDQFIPEYIAGDGLTDLDMWSGDRCGIFLLHNPPQEWVEYTRAQDHVWWRTFGEDRGGLEEELMDVPVLHVGNGQMLTPRQLLPSGGNRGLAKQQVAAVLSYFGLAPTSHPCLILFRDLEDLKFWLVELEDMLGLDIPRLRIALKQWFAGASFKRLLKV